MKKIVLAVAVLAVSATSAFAVVGVSGTKHDLSATSAMSGGGSNQKCIYCHTPHNTQVAVPLWNRINVNNVTAVYNSATLTTVAAGASISADSISGFCMSCHDGTTAMGNIKNKAGATDNSVSITGLSGYNAKNNLGTTLANDHPVGFNYASAVNAETDGGLISYTQASSNLGGNAFFGGAKQDMECASCHKVHDNTATPFLRLSNSGSNLCLACHVK